MRRVLAVVVLLISGCAGLVLVRLHANSPLERTDAQIVADALPRLNFQRSALEDGSAEEMQGLFPEGYFFSYVLYGLAWVDVGARDERLRPRALEEARWALRHLESDKGREVFPPDSVFYVGWSARLRGGVAQLAGVGAPEEAQLRSDASTLARLFRAETFPTSYPGQAWPCDAVVGIAALKLAGAVLGTDHSGVITKWLSDADARRDRVTGLLPHTDEVGDGARATSQVIILRFLPEVDWERSRADWRRFREVFGSNIPAFPGIREYPRGTDSDGDVDSGPLVFGLSFSASAVALGGAVVHHDREMASQLAGLAEAMGMAVEFGGERRYAGGLMPIGDAFLTWSMTARPPTGEEISSPAFAWRFPWYAGFVLFLLPMWIFVFWANARRKESGGETRL